MNTWNRLSSFERQFGLAPIAVVGAGYVGTGVVQILTQAPGLRPAIVVNRNTDRAVSAYTSVGVAKDDVLVSDNVDDLSYAIKINQPAVAQHYEILENLNIRAVVEATGAMDYGTRAVLSCLEYGFNVVSYNAEVDALLGWLLHKKAKDHGVIYTIADGDQPGALFRLAEQVEAMGFDVTTMLNCKRHLDIHQNPESGAGFSERDTTSARMTTAFGDGTKMQVEQAVVANATGMVPDVRGMHGIATTQEHVIRDCESIVASGKRVDFTLGGDFAAGVGVIATHHEVALHSRALSLYKMGEGPQYFFFRPYHLVHLELPNTLAQLLIDHQAVVSVESPHVADVVSISKKALKSGEQLDGIGGYSAYGEIELYEDGLEFLPIGLAEFAIMIKDVEKDRPIPLAAVQLDTSLTVVKEWQKMRQQWSKLSHQELEVP